MASGEHRFIDVDGLKTRYLDKGSGSPILLVHGLGASLIVWRDNIEPLSRSHRVLAMDIPGHGDSDKPRMDYGLDTGTGFIKGFLDATGIEKATLVGSSLGGIMVLKAALEYPERVNSLVLVDSAGLGREIAWFVRLASLPLLGNFLEQPSVTGAETLLANVFYDRRFATDGLAKELYRTRHEPGAKQAVLSALRRGINLLGVRREFILLNELQKLTMPLLIVWGAQDKIFPVEHARRAARVMPRAMLRVFDQCGHWPQIEKAEEFNQMMIDFLKQS